MVDWTYIASTSIGGLIGAGTAFILQIVPSWLKYHESRREIKQERKSADKAICFELMVNLQSIRLLQNQIQSTIAYTKSATYGESAEIARYISQSGIKSEKWEKYGTYLADYPFWNQISKTYAAIIALREQKNCSLNNLDVIISRICESILILDPESDPNSL